MMMSRAQTNAKTADLKILKDSMDVFMAKMRGIKAEKRWNANAWVVRQLSKKQRDMLALHELKLPSKTLRWFMDQLSGSSGSGEYVSFKTA